MLTYITSDKSLVWYFTDKLLVGLEDSSKRDRVGFQIVKVLHLYLV